jgi:dCMP deaminase
MVIHAEQNTLLGAGTRARGGTIYVYGKPVCPRCAVLLIQSGVKRVVAIQPEPEKNPDSDTHNDGVISLRMFEEAGITFDAFDADKKMKEKTDK